MRAHIIVFKQSGKFYTDLTYEFKANLHHEMMDEMRELLRSNKIPGLVEGAQDFDVLVTPEDGVQVPRLFVSERRVKSEV